MGTKTAVQPGHISWDEFVVRRAETGEEPDGRPKPAAKNRRQASALSALLLEAIAVASARGRLSQAERVHLRTLLQVLNQALQRAR